MKKKLTDEISKMFNQSIQHSYVGLKVLTNLIEEIQSDDKNLFGSKSIFYLFPLFTMIGRYRRNVINFRDRVLPNIVEISFYFLKNMGKMFESQPEITNQNMQEEFLKTVLNLIFSALNYDFLGEKQDSTELFIDEYAPLQIPNNKTSFKSPEVQTKWNILSNEETINLIFEHYYISEK